MGEQSSVGNADASSAAALVSIQVRAAASSGTTRTVAS
jgi:hypothetical protein